MAILIFNRSSVFDYPSWLADSDQELVVFTQREIPTSEAYAALETFDSFDRSGRAELRALELRERYQWRHVFGHSEYDLVRAARLRERLSLPGQSVESAQAYRDKARMKEHASASGIAVPAFRRLSSPLDLVDFADAHGYPVVVKPIDGGGSRGVSVLRDAAAVGQFLEMLPDRPYIIESFVAGEMYHVDGVWHEDRMLFAAASRYLAGCLAYQRGDSLGSMILPPQSALHGRLVDETTAIIRALPRSPLVAFHAEIFVTDDGRMVLCEIASRTGGALVAETLEVAYGVNINRLWTRLACGLPADSEPRSAPAPYAGWLVIPPCKGELLDAPQQAPFEWCERFLVPAKAGDRCTAPVASVDHVAMAIVTGDNETEVEERLRRVDRWFADTVVWNEHADEAA